MIRATEERRKTMSKRFNVKSVAILGILVAAEIIFARFSIHK